MKKLIENIIQKRNPTFHFDENISDGVLISMLLDKLIMWIRGLKLLIYFKQPKLLLLGKNVSFFNISRIRLGKWVKIESNTHLSALGKGLLKIGNNTSIGAFSRIEISQSFNNLGSHIHIGNNVGLGAFTMLGGAGGLEIGDDCIVGQYFSCHPENHIYSSDETPIRLQGVTRKGIKIGKNCWIGAKVTVLDGVEIGDGCVVAAGSVVTKSFGSNLIIGGVPANVLKPRVEVSEKPISSYKLSPEMAY